MSAYYGSLNSYVSKLSASFATTFGTSFVAFEGGGAIICDCDLVIVVWGFFTSLSSFFRICYFLAMV